MDSSQISSFTNALFANRLEARFWPTQVSWHPLLFPSEYLDAPDHDSITSALKAVDKPEEKKAVAPANATSALNVERENVDRIIVSDFILSFILLLSSSKCALTIL
jgi:hypothetical protein